MKRCALSDCILDIRWTKELIKAVPAHTKSRLGRRGLSNPANTQTAKQFRTGLHEIWDAVGGEVGADAASWWPLIDLKGLTQEV